MVSLTVIFENKLSKKRAHSTALHICLYMCIALCLYITLSLCTGANAQQQITQLITFTVNESYVQSTWNDYGLDGICQYDIPNVNGAKAARIFSPQDQRILEEVDGTINSETTKVYIGVRLYPDVAQGWFWAGENESENGAIEFYTSYSNGGQPIGYNNWADNGSPSINDPYNSKQAIIYNQTAGGWQAVALQTNGVAKVACFLEVNE